jgi:hypothetical protein
MSLEHLLLSWYPESILKPRSGRVKPRQEDLYRVLSRAGGAVVDFAASIREVAHGGVRPVRQKSTYPTKITLRPYVVQIRSRNLRKSERAAILEVCVHSVTTQSVFWY